MPSPAIIRALPSATARPSTRPRTPVAGHAPRSPSTGASAEAARLGAADDRLGERVLGAALEAGGEAQHLGLVVAGRGQHRGELGAAEGQGAGLVDDEGVDGGEASRAPRRRGPARPAWAPRPVAVMIEIGVARPSAQGQAMISTAIAETSA